MLDGAALLRVQAIQVCLSRCQHESPLCAESRIRQRSAMRETLTNERFLRQERRVRDGPSHPARVTSLLAVLLSIEREALSAPRPRRRRVCRLLAHHGLRPWCGLCALFACAAGVEEEAVATTDVDAVIAVRALALRAGQRTDAIGLAADGIQRIKARHLDVEFGPGVVIE